MCILKIVNPIKGLIEGYRFRRSKAQSSHEMASVIAYSIYSIYYIY